MKALGLMSGTSCDGVSAAVIDGLRVVNFRTFPYPPELRRRLLKLPNVDALELSTLNGLLGERFARAALAMDAGRVVIGSHGHTAVHHAGGTLQIGEPSIIAERTGCTVVADFRPRDIAAGGQGAPLVPIFDEALFGDGPPRVLLNIGGIANLAVVGRGVRTYGFDTGPGNTLIDLVAPPFDRNGAKAARTKIEERKLRRMLAHPYFRKKPPKSTGRELFNRAWLPMTPATATMLTVRSIADAIRRFVRERIHEVVVSGGGVYNRTLMRWLAEAVPMPVRSIEEFGIHPLAKEPAAFAYMAVLAVQAKPNNVPAVTGARGRVVMGKIVPGTAGPTG